MAKEAGRCRVCVIGGSSFIGSRLVKELLDEGHAVHTTLRDLGDDSKTGMLRSLPGTTERLTLFQADIYDPETYETAIGGCEFVFLVATPYLHQPTSIKYKDTTEAAVSAVKTILRICEESEMVERVIFAGSLTSASPFAGADADHCPVVVDEGCWTPLDASLAHAGDFLRDYVNSKTCSERVLLEFNGDGGGERKRTKPTETVSLAIGTVGGDTVLAGVPMSVRMIVSQLTGDREPYRKLRFIDSLIESLPFVHVDDLCRAFVFYMRRLFGLSWVQVSFWGQTRFVCRVEFLACVPWVVGS